VNTQEEQFLQSDCLIVAAGTSSRMGEWKMFLPFKSATIIEKSIENALAVCKRVILVTGFRGEELEQIFKDNRRVECIRNSNYQKGMFSSVKKGVPTIETGHFFITLGDKPGIPPSVFTKLAESPGPKAVFPSYKGEIGHPVLLPKAIIPVINRAHDRQNMRDILRFYPRITIPVQDRGVVVDIDTQTDYEYAKSIL
jgi:molybdenum cofactor cytidylyltransferase